MVPGQAVVQPRLRPDALVVVDEVAAPVQDQLSQQRDHPQEMY